MTTTEIRSTWVVPVQGTPSYIANGVLEKSHFQGMPYLQVWAEKSSWCDHVVDAQMRVLSGSYWNPAMREPLVVLPWADVPTIADASKPGGRAVWPAPGHQIKGQANVSLEIHAYGDFPSEVLNVTDSPNCNVRLHLHGTAAWLWTMKGMVTVERSPNCTIEVVCGTGMATTVVRGIGSASPVVTLHSAVVARGRNLDSGLTYLIARHKGLDGKTAWSECGGSVTSYANLWLDSIGLALNNFALPFKRADIMGDDWWCKARLVARNGTVYVSGPDNTVSAAKTILDPRSGKEWEPAKVACPWPANLRDTVVTDGIVTVL